MKTIIKNVDNNRTHLARFFRFEQATIYTLNKILDCIDSGKWDRVEKTITFETIFTPIASIGLHKKLPKTSLLLFLGNTLRSMAKGHFSERKSELSSLHQFQAFPPKCNTQLVYSKGRRDVDLFFYLNNSRNR